MSLYVSSHRGPDFDRNNKFVDVARHLGDGHIRISVGEEDAELSPNDALRFAEAILESVRLARS